MCHMASRGDRKSRRNSQLTSKDLRDTPRPFNPSTRAAANTTEQTQCVDAAMNTSHEQTQYEDADCHEQTQYEDADSNELQLFDDGAEKTDRPLVSSPGCFDGLRIVFPGIGVSR